MYYLISGRCSLYVKCFITFERYCLTKVIIIIIIIISSSTSSSSSRGKKKTTSLQHCLKFFIFYLVVNRMKYWWHLSYVGDIWWTWYVKQMQRQNIKLHHISRGWREKSTELEFIINDF